MTEPDVVRFILTDSDVKGDKRVVRNIAAGAMPVEIVDIRKFGYLCRTRESIDFAVVVLLLVCGLIASLFRFKRVKSAYRLSAQHAQYSGATACILWLKQSVRAATHLRERLRGHAASVVYANDLYCAVASILLPKRSVHSIVYDSHELQTHRNRRSGEVRTWIEFGLEQLVLSRVSEVRVVNNAIRAQMEEWYTMPSRVVVDYNDHYAFHEPMIPEPTARPALVYVGKGVDGRMLEAVDAGAGNAGFDVYAYLLGAALPSGIRADSWHMGPVDYEADLQNTVVSRRSMMWCCLEPTSLSYKLATPNKFFQALAMAMPIIASRGTYLEEIVRKYDIGAVFDGGNLPQIAEQLRGDDFARWVRNVVQFRSDLKSGVVAV